jgi:transcriptional regulator with XRE-family HTH domain
MADPELGRFLRDRRERLDPVAFGYGGRRRTPGLRREEVAQRANISATWYSWLEQGRGGAPSAEVLDQVARALMLSDAERDHLFLLGIGQPAAAHFRPPSDITPRLQRVLDAMHTSPALISTVGWDVVAWNAAAAAVLSDYASLPPAERNVLRRVFLDPRSRAAYRDWEEVARFVVAVFRAGTRRAGTGALAEPLVQELRRDSTDFACIWDDNEVRGLDDGVKHLRHPMLGEIALEFSAFAVDGRPDLMMLVFNPTSPEDAVRIRALVEPA